MRRLTERTDRLVAELAMVSRSRCAIATACGKARTRGDGVTGEDVSSNLRTIQDPACYEAALRRAEVRGEVYIRKASFVSNARPRRW